MATSIKGKPTKTVSNLALTRKGVTRTISAQWKASTQLTTLSSSTRATSTKVVWTVNVKNWKTGKTAAYTRTVKNNSMGQTKGSLNTAVFTSDKNKEYTRASFYPGGKVDGVWQDSDLLLTSVKCSVYAVNSKGVSAKAASKTYKFKKPGVPTVTNLTQAEETGHICFEIKAFDWKDKANERYDTQYEITIETVMPDPEDPSQMKTDTVITADQFTTDTREFVDQEAEGKYVLEVPHRFDVGYEGYIRVSVRVRSRGYAGASNWCSPQSIVVSYPAKPLLGEPQVDMVTDGSGPAIQSTGMVTIPVQTNQAEKFTDEMHPITGLRLEKLVSTTATTAAQAIEQGSNWEATEIVDDGQCVALTTNVADLKPTRGLRTWVRVKCWNQHENLFYRYSDPVEVKDLYTDPLSSSGTATIRSLTSGNDGTSLVASIGWTEVGEIPMTGTEVSWSKDEYAWRSTTGPETYEFDWHDEKDPVADVDFDGVAVLHIQGLEDGELYCVRVRRYHDDDEGERTYGAYSDIFRATPVSTPASVSIKVPEYVARGRDVEVTWTYDSEAEQKEWHLRVGKSVEGDHTGDEGELTIAPREWDGDPLEAENGENANGAVVLGADRIASLLDLVGSTDELSFAITMGTGGGTMTSNIAVMKVVDPPTLDMTIPTTVTEQGFDVTLESNVKADVVIVARAADSGNTGTAGQTPGRGADQAEGDVMWQQSFTPEWVEDNGVYTATFAAPFMDLLDGGAYEVEATATDGTTGLSSDSVTGKFDVTWTYQAPHPPEELTIVPSDFTDADGNRTRSCEIHLEAPTGAETTDVYDVYRLTPDGAYLIAEDVEMDAVITDPYAPFGGTEIGYRVCSRTADGDMDWNDYSYSLPGRDLRIDFGAEYVELPWDLTLSDSYTKDFEARQKLDGSVDGYWNDGVVRKGGFRTDLIRIREQDQAARVRRLARYVGPVFVRTPDGCAYAADVQVTDLSGARKDAALAVTLDATEVGMTDEFMATVPVDEQEEVEP